MYEIWLNEAVLHDSDVNSELRLSADFCDRKDVISVKNTVTNETEFEGVLMFHEQSMTSDGRLCIKAFAEGFLGYLMRRSHPKNGYF